MIQINAAVFILVVEILVVLLVLVTVVTMVVVRRKRKKLQAIAQLVEQIKKQSEVRTKETGSFLQDIYQLENESLKKAVDTIDKSEKVFFQKLIDSYLTLSPEIIASMDASVAGLIDVYKDLRPKELVIDNTKKDEMEKLKKEVEKLREENKRLDEELGITKNTMGNMIAEFGNMFGGGSDHELAKHEVVEKVESQSVESDKDIGEL